MKETPILFNADMMKAILAGNKTQTIRVIKGVNNKNWLESANNHVVHAADHCPYGKPGDRLLAIDAEDTTILDSRIILEIKSVRAEKLNRISEEDAIAEGVEELRKGYWKNYEGGWTQFSLSAKGSFLTLWESINGKGSFDGRWVWVIEFERLCKKQRSTKHSSFADTA